ncbi:hypothetical protein AMTR_s00010p00265250 [Amborella trichopoda]|uniref:Uncharacterized protein n=1 Tax=Amborella trichopoda TaxID=13333 RepID=W1NGB2_AMBTC|nr:hypothetical protein AMTR_s00010p00265250 [Amborella trichopoda]
MGPNEPYWQNNSSFSPPLSRRWDYRFQSEGLPYGSHGGIQLYGSSLSSNSKESRSRVSSERFPNPQYSASDGMVSYISSPSDSFQTQLGTPPVQGVNLEEFVSSAIGGVKVGIYCLSAAICYCREDLVARMGLLPRHREDDRSIKSSFRHH